MAVTRTIHKSYGNRIGGSFKGVVVGFVLFIVGIVALFWNEGRTVRAAQDIAYGEKNVEEVANVATPDPAQEGKFVHFHGKAVTDETLADKDFGVSVNGLRLERTVEMYQWMEDEEKEEKVNVGGSSDTTITYTYKKGWSETPINSSEFQEKGHDNPSTMAYESAEWQAESVSLGGFRLPGNVVNRIHGERAFAFPEDYALPAALAERAVVQSGRIYIPVKGFPKVAAPVPASAPVADTNAVAATAADTNAVADVAAATNAVAESVAVTNAPAAPEARTYGDPEVGDLRIAFQWVPCHDVSIMAQQVGDTVCAFRAKNGELLYVSDGILTADAMIADAKKANSFFGWLLRLLGFVLLYGGMKQILGPIDTLASVLPFLGRVAGVGTGLIAALVAIPVGLVTVAIAWLVYRPIIGITILVLAVAAFVFLKRKIPAKA